MGLLEGKVGLVTGSGSGIGRATAISATIEGSCVTVAEKNADTGKETVDIIRKKGGKAIFVQTDVRIAEDIQKMIAQTIETFGRLDWASNNAAGGSGAFQAAYASAKGGVEALTKTAAAEFAQRGIRVNSICPAAICTPALERYLENFPEFRKKIEGTHAMNRLGTPEEVADAVIYLASEKSSFMTGHSLVIDGGCCVNTAIS